MLKELHISNFAIIEDLTIEFEEGFNLLTGETGSGKSIIIEALELVLGGRGSREMIRSGCDKAVVEAMFALNDKFREALSSQGFEAEDWLILTRELSEKYPSVSRINGRPVTLSTLSSFTKGLVDVFGQHEHQSLLDVSNHIRILDMLLDAEGRSIIAELARDHEIYRELAGKREELVISSQERERELDLLEFQINEIAEANLTPEDDEKLELEFKRLFNLKDIIAGASLAGDAISSREYGQEGALALLDRAIASLKDIKKYDEKLLQYSNKLDSLRYELEDIGRELSHYCESQEIDEEKLFSLRERLDKVNSLKKKYGNSVELIMQFKYKTEDRREKLLNLDKELSQLDQRINALQAERLKKAERLSILRREAAERLDRSMESELQSLSMENVLFKTSFTRKNEVGKYGIDEVEFLISTNPGEDLKPLSRIVSGGEMSRIMLAFKGIIADGDGIPVLIFDEIDTGISGRTAQVVGEKIKRIAVNHQVISVSHLPQIAALADTHFAISKDSRDKDVITLVRKLSREERIEELARLISGASTTETTLKHAREMLELSNKVK
ncbi:DNA repair protein RecN [Gudongella oleilytica]|uniref:DNA repair protein RecN n=1 Tax=Gudongella oleilytica TaxID=1582259 RepID=UPI000FF87F32|nr:DNA repair protein RecN [Gudongella oleilytica]